MITTYFCDRSKETMYLVDSGVNQISTQEFSDRVQWLTQNLGSGWGHKVSGSEHYFSFYSYADAFSYVVRFR